MGFTTRRLPLLAFLASPLRATAQAADYEVGTDLVWEASGLLR